jgi:hypothetical protein
MVPGVSSPSAATPWPRCAWPRLTHRFGVEMPPPTLFAHLTVDGSPRWCETWPAHAGRRRATIPAMRESTRSFRLDGLPGPQVGAGKPPAGLCQGRDRRRHHGQERREPEVFVSKAFLPDPRDAVRSGQ